MAMESGMPQGPGKSEEEIEAERQENDRQFGEEAATANDNRGFFKKKLNIGELSSLDMAQEEANRVNESVDNMTAREGISAQAASSEILDSGEFALKGEDSIKAEAYIRSRIPDMAKLDIASARSKLEKAVNGIKDIKEAFAIRRTFDKMISNQIDTMIKSNDREGLSTLIKKNYLDDIGLQSIARMPKEIIESTELQQKMVDDINKGFSGDRIMGAAISQRFIEHGLMSKQSVAALFQGEGYQDKIESDIKKAFSNSRHIGRNTATEYVKEGLMTQEKMSAMFQSAEFQGALVGDIRKAFRSNRQIGYNVAEEYVKEGFIGQGTMKELFESDDFQKALEEDIRKAFRGNRQIGHNVAEEYVKKGFVTEKRADKILDALKGR